MTRALRVILAEPRGFCAGVVRAVEIVERALRLHGAPVYVRHEIVHNRRVVDDLRAKGAVFINEVDEAPAGSLTIFSAHGVSEQVERDAQARKLDVIDAICPLVQRVHTQAQRYAAMGYNVVLVGHAGHPEVEGVRGRVPGGLSVVGSVDDVAQLAFSDASRVAYVTQTTLSVPDTQDIIAALAARFPAIVGPNLRDICYATHNRQTAVMRLAQQVELLLVVGSANSSNSNRLREIAEASGVRAHLIDGAQDIELAWLEGVRSVGLTAGASAPEVLVQGVVAWMAERYHVQVDALEGMEEKVEFRLPPRLADPQLVDHALAETSLDSPARVSVASP